MPRNNHTAKFLWILLGCCLVIMTTPTYAQSTNRFAYAFLGRLADGQSRLMLIDPIAPQNAAQQMQLELPPETPYIQKIEVSPDGIWIASTVKEWTILRITNLITGQFHDIDGGTVMSMSWSPNLEYLAIVVGESRTFSTLVYSLKTQKLKKYPSENTYYGQRIAWSSDSRYLVTTTSFCPDPCTVRLSVYNISTDEKVDEVDVSYLSQGSAVLANLMCELGWSPDGQYVSFAAGCDLSTDRTLKDVYLWHVGTDEVKRITDFTVDILKDERVKLVGARYKLWWQDDNTLRMGVVTWIDDPTPKDSFTAQYQVREDTLQIISETGSAQWTVNPVTGDVAYITSESVNLTESIAANSKLIVAIASEGKLTPEREFNGGCYPAWSPDGKLLTVLTYTTPSCLAGLKSIVFIDPTTGDSHQHDIAVDQGLRADWAQPIGWVRTN